MHSFYVDFTAESLFDVQCTVKPNNKYNVIFGKKPFIFIKY